ncbi:MAG: alanine--tRNA ligase [Thermoleophilia bacterium]|nr:alanine--tRNA ligase [Thermoleophilia bacterium]
MPRVTTSEIREGFLRYFEREDHLRIPSSSLVPFEDDPSVLLTIAGMQPLKSYFLGRSQPPAARMTSAQKCFRTLDIDQVGRTARHLTFFEMLGNFSIGDYFKDDAIRFGFELSTEVLGFDPEQIWITVFAGMDGVPADDEALERWVELGIPRERIQRLGEADNFWKAGPTGPCGPNTELYLDRGPAFGPDGGPVTGTDRFLEFWNLVFMQYDRAEDGTLTTLPARNIDTGAGLERLAAILQDRTTIFETDGFRPLIAWAEQASGRTYGTHPRTDRSMRVLADHSRAMTFLAADGVRPGNDGRDYILRRIIRRAVSEAASLGLAPTRLVGLVDIVADGYGDAYPEIIAERSSVADVVGAEAEQFARTLEQGTRLLEEVLARSRSGGVISGDDAFRLHDTFGFPLDLTCDAAAEHGVQVDEAGFDLLMEAQRDRARAAARTGTGVTRTAAESLSARTDTTQFVGYDELEVVTVVTALMPLDDGEALVKVARSPFYAEGGGQVSDDGWVTGAAGSARVLDVLRVGDDQVLRVAITGDLPEGASVTATVDVARRHATQANHTATHVLGWALRGVLGDGVRQAGSYVGPDKLRFDFRHRGRIAPDVLEEIEAEVNARVAEDTPVRTQVMPRAEADALGAIGLFEEKYGEVVRVVQTGDFSNELCGGCHVSRTGEIGPLVIVSAGSSGADTRRIEAVTGLAALDHLRLRNRDLADEVAQQDERIRRLEADLKAARSGRVDVAAIVDAAEVVGVVCIVAAEVDAADMDELLALTDRVAQAMGPGSAVVLGAGADGKALLVAKFDEAAVSAGMSATDLMREVAPVVGGGGGGKPGLARAGGTEAEHIPEAIDRAWAVLRSVAG